MNDPMGRDVQCDVQRGQACLPDEHARVADVWLNAGDEHRPTSQLQAHHGAGDCAALRLSDSLPAAAHNTEAEEEKSQTVPKHPQSASHGRASRTPV